MRSIHRRVRRLCQRVGRRVTFKRPAIDYDEVNDAHTPSDTAISGYMMQSNTSRTGQIGNDDDLVQTSQARYVFAPDRIGDTPLPGDECDWPGGPWNTVSVDPVAPAGETLFARVEIAQ